MKDDQRDNYEKTIYVVLETGGVTVKVTHVLTSKLKVWEYLTETCPIHMYNSHDNWNTKLGKSIPTYSAFCKRLIPYPTKFITADQQTCTVVSTWKV